MIREFQAGKKNSIQVPSDKQWIADLAFLVDITELRNTLNLDSSSEELQMELLEFQSDSDLQSKFRQLPVQQFCKCVPAARYGKIQKHAQVMLSLFGSTHLCE